MTYIVIYLSPVNQSVSVTTVLRPKMQSSARSPRPLW